MLRLRYASPVPNEQVNLAFGPTRERHYSRIRDVSGSSGEGENLIFIVGAPRSGTTWLLKLLEEHPDVLGVRRGDLGLGDPAGPYLETGVFTEAAGLPDSEIRERFRALTERNPGKVLVEKTPVHLMCVDRIREVFPKAAIIMTRREGRDAFASMLAAGKDPESWWSDAPTTAEAAAKLWLDYAIASSRCEGCYNPYVVRYEDLVFDTEGTLEELLRAHGLDQAYVRSQVDTCVGGRNIEVPGVFRRGIVGGWKGDLSPAELEVFEIVAGKMNWRPVWNRSEQPDLTVVLSCFERPRSLSRSVQSLLDQTILPRMEVIVCDDGSSNPATRRMLRMLENREGFRVIRGDRTSPTHKEGFCTFTQLINRAMHCASGRYVTYLCDGDEYRPNRCGLHVKFLDENPDCFAVWSRSEWLRDGVPEAERGFNGSASELRNAIANGNFIDHCEFTHRRTGLRWSTSPYSWRFADWLFLQRLLLDGKGFEELDAVTQVKHYDSESLGRSMGERKEAFVDVVRRRMKG